ncbi:MAG: MFS transporter [Comamonas sp.]|uniref:MFS transporter n=1 Tax=Comamonas sp. TaxID=34028 RepID=UPI0028307282|nr:MFS transporter [Comamonas sp.]MDR0215602.1 MFS transporter [Comamonas sp.]
MSVQSLITRAFPAFAEPAIGRYLSGQLASVFGTWIQNITLSLFLWQETHSAFMVGLLNFLLQGPMLFVPMLVGARLQPATVKITTLRILGCSLSLSALLLVTSLFGWLESLLILAIAACLGLTQAMEWPSRQLLLSSSLSDRTLLTNAVAMNALMFNIGRMTGPAFAAMLFSQVSISAGFICSVVGLLVMLRAIHGLPELPVTPPVASGKPGIAEALRFVAGDSFAQKYVPLLICFGLFTGSYQTIIPPLAATTFDSLSHYTGVFFACAGAGSLTAAIALSSLRDSQIAKHLLSFSPSVAAFALIGIGLSQSGALSGTCFFAIGLCLALTTTQINAGLQQRSPERIRGGVVGLYAVAFIGSMPLGHMLMGAIASAMGPQPTFVLMGLLMASTPWLLRRIAAMVAKWVMQRWPSSLPRND